MDIRLAEDRARVGWLSYEAIVIAAFFVLNLTIFPAIDIGVVVVGTGLLMVSMSFGGWPTAEPERLRNAALIGTVLLLGAGMAAWFIDDHSTAVTSALLVLPALGAGWLALRGALEERELRTVAAGLLVVVVVAIGAIQIVDQPEPVIDVFELHVSAADAVLSGRNPYVEATAVNTAPTAVEGELVVGYPYPPLALIAYGGGEILFGDPRWASVIAIAVTVLLLIRPWATMTRAQAGAAVAIGLALVTQPVLSHIVNRGWTEPIAVPMLLGVGLLFRRYPLASAVLLGLTLGLKQYWIVALPLLFIWKDGYRWKRVLIAGCTAALSLLPAFLLNPGAAWDSIVVDLMEVPARVDSIGIAGLGWVLPMWLIVAASTGAAWWMGRSGGPAPRFQLGLLATLAVAFLLGSQAFLNYWFLIASGAIVAVATGAAMADQRRPQRHR